MIFSDISNKQPLTSDLFQIADAGINVNAVPVTESIKTNTTTTTFEQAGHKVTETVIAKTIHKTVHMSPTESAAQKRPHEDSPLKKQFDGELGSLVAWMEDTEQKLLSTEEPTPEDPNLEEQMKTYSVCINYELVLN